MRSSSYFLSHPSRSLVTPPQTRMNAAPWGGFRLPSVSRYGVLGLRSISSVTRGQLPGDRRGWEGGKGKCGDDDPRL